LGDFWAEQIEQLTMIIEKTQINAVVKMAKRTQKEIKALKDAGYVWNQHSQSWMSQEELLQWNAEAEKGAETGKVVYALQIIFVVVVTTVTFLIYM
jgi:hypothetical protein